MGMGNRCLGIAWGTINGQTLIVNIIIGIDDWPTVVPDNNYRHRWSISTINLRVSDFTLAAHPPLGWPHPKWWSWGWIVPINTPSTADMMVVRAVQSPVGTVKLCFSLSVPEYPPRSLWPWPGCCCCCCWITTNRQLILICSRELCEICYPIILASVLYICI